eukprot:CAMPEP_0119313272 /NCGR_PEP_ID=MMETSP1333-20130426/28576_1 /TAXON_ID=418940 /ORGANISM="Scyphosphaera apsteinii, Strain RCC1455" /LENGTH=229 /DNA_ID=CAMNT_0007318075 /DNA_START=8 /DNA_END=700 /DNA_ORIENTATION=+
MAMIDQLEDDMGPDHNDIRRRGGLKLAHESGRFVDPPIVAASRIFGKRKDPDGNQLKAALEQGADINGQDKDGYTALMLACKSVNVKLAQLLLNVDGIDLNLQNKRGFTAPMIAATKHWCGTFQLTGLVRDMLDRGADVKIQDDGGRTLWGVCVDQQNEEVLELLYERGHNYYNSGMDLDEDRMFHLKYGPRTWPNGQPQPRPDLPEDHPWYPLIKHMDEDDKIAMSLQ